MGPQGLRELADISLQRAHYLADKLTKIEGVKLAFDQPYFNEFALSLPVAADSVLRELEGLNILGGIALSKHFKHMPELENSILVAVTEMNPKEELDQFAEALTGVLTQLQSKGQAKTAQKKVLTV